MTIVFLNGNFLPIENAHVSVMDRGFLFADGVYEVIPVYDGKCFRLEEHLRRLDRSLKEIHLPFAIDPTFWQNIFTQLIAQNGGGNQSLYLQITRGAAMTRDHTFPLEFTPTLFAFSKPYELPTLAQLEKGIKAITIEDLRWKRCDIKAITLLANLLAKQAAKEQNASEAILINNGFAVEGATSNIFIVKNDTLITPPMGHNILGGITRDLILEIAEKHAIHHEERAIPAEDLYTADELWITSSSREAQPVTELNSKVIGTGQAGPMWHKIIGYYQEYKKR